MSLGNYENNKMGLNENRLTINYFIYLLAIFFLSLLFINLFMGITIDELRSMIKESKNHNIRLIIEYTLNIQDVLVNFFPFKSLRKNFISSCVLFDINNKEAEYTGMFYRKIASYFISDKKSKNDRLKDAELREMMENFMKQLNQRMNHIEDGLHRNQHELSRQTNRLTQQITKLSKTLNVEKNGDDKAKMEENRQSFHAGRDIHKRNLVTQQVSHEEIIEGGTFADD